MLQFVQSIWLWAAAGIIVPVVIHLWNVKQGKTLKVGSIAFFTESAKSHAKSFKLSELFLLLLRCLLLIVLAMLIAVPFYEKPIKLEKEKGWILIEKQQVKEAYQNYKTAIDTLLKSGYTFHYFENGFTEVKFEEVLKLSQDTLTHLGASYWTLLKELDQKVTSQLPVYLFTNNNLRRFTGSRPGVSLNLKWHVYHSSDTMSTWIEKAYETTNDSIKLVTANSNPTGTSYTYQNISPAGLNNKFSLITGNGKTFVRFRETPKTVSNKPVEIDTSTLIITIYTDRFSLDANYLRAAINAVKDFTKFKIKISVVRNVQSIPLRFNWLFWLSEETIPAALMKNNVFVYEKGKVENLRSQIITDDKAGATIPDEIPVFKSIQSNLPVAKPLEVVWKNGFGEPVLAVQKQNASVYHFYSRFNPQWNDMPWSSQFPQIILNLLLHQDKNLYEINGFDKRTMDANQIQPIITVDENPIPKQSLVEKKDLSKLFWIIALILFVIERIVSFKRKKEEVYG